MFSALFVFGCVAAFGAPGRSCPRHEFQTRDGRCCPMCFEGSVVGTSCTETSVTHCVACEDGTFMNQRNALTTCFRCSTCDPGLGLFEQHRCNSTADTVCEALIGHFCTMFDGDTGCSFAVQHTVCEPGQRIKEPGNSRSDTVCEACEPGHFSEGGVSCSPWSICSESQVKVREGSSVLDVVCDDR